MYFITVLLSISLLVGEAYRSQSTQRSGWVMNVKQHEKMYSLVPSIVTTATCISIFCIPFPSFAAALTTSELFSRAETAIEKTEKDYKTLLSDWGQTKKILEESMQPIIKTDELLKTVTKDLSLIVNKVAASADEVSSVSAVIASQIEALTEETATKYNAAEELSKAGAPPAKTARKFAEAESSAAILAQEGSLLQKYKETAGGVTAALTKAKEALTSAEGTVSKINKLVKQQSDGEALLAGGVDVSVRMCRDSLAECGSKQQDGVLKFKTGQSDIRKAAAGLAQEIQDIKSNQRKVQSVAAELELLSSRLQVQLEEVDEWQRSTHLRLPKMPPSKPIFDKLREADKATVSVLERFVRARDLVSEKENRARSEAVDKQLGRVDKALTVAEEEGRRAHSLLLAAKASGDRDSAKYLAASKSAKATATTVAAKK